MWFSCYFQLGLSQKKGNPEKRFSWNFNMRRNDTDKTFSFDFDRQPQRSKRSTFPSPTATQNAPAWSSWNNFAPTSNPNAAFKTFPTPSPSSNNGFNFMPTPAPSFNFMPTPSPPSFNNLYSNPAGAAAPSWNSGFNAPASPFAAPLNSKGQDLTQLQNMKFGIF